MKSMFEHGRTGKREERRLKKTTEENKKEKGRMRRGENIRGSEEERKMRERIHR
jgi:hypothetical protein